MPRARIGDVTGRLKRGVSLASAETELTAIARRLATEFPDSNAGRGVRLEPLAQTVVQAPVRRVLYLLFAAVGLLLALASANVANLSLARMTFRRREVGVRAALGAGGWRLARQFFAESLLLAVAGGAVGLVLSCWATGGLLRVAAAHVPRVQDVGLDWRVFLFFLGACAVTGIALAFAPAFAAIRHDAGATPPSASAHATPAGTRLRDALVVAEVAIALVLAISAAMLVRELVRLRQTDAGLVPANVMTFHLGHRSTPETDVRQFYDIEARVEALAQVRAAGLTQLLPLQNWGWSATSSDFLVRGLPPVEPIFPIQLRYVTPGYFETLGIPIRQGRSIAARDERNGPPVIVINEALARRYFGDVNPVGHLTTRGTIVGVVGDVRQASLDLPALPELYFPAAQNWSQLPELGMTLVVATHDEPTAVVDAVRSIVRGVNPDLAVFDVKTMDRVIDDSLSGFTLFLSLMAGLAALALILSMTGTYGVIAYIASSRTKEFAIRVALGAGRARVVRTVLGHGVLLASIGLVVGLMATLAAVPLTQNLPVTIGPPDTITLAAVAAFVAGVATLACAVPAIRAAAIDPALALRND
jgi:predicted permease